MLDFHFQTRSYTGGTLPARGMVESDETGPLTRPPLRVRTRQALAAPARARRTRQAVLAAARAQEARRQAGVRTALEALSALLPPAEEEPCRTVAEQLERRYAALRQARRESAALMAREPNASTALAVRAPGAINGQEARYSRRWQSSSRDYLASLEDERGQLLDWACYSVRPDGTRVPVVIERKRGKRRTTAGTAATRAARAARAGTIRMAEVG
jgi:hypothetical protein